MKIIYEKPKIKEISARDIPKYTFFTGKVGARTGLFYKIYDSIEIFNSDDDSENYAANSWRLDVYVSNYQCVNITITVKA